MAKEREIELRVNGEPVGKISRPIVRGDVCYGGTWYPVQPGNWIAVPRVEDHHYGRWGAGEDRVNFTIDSTAAQAFVMLAGLAAPLSLRGSRMRGGRQ